MVGWLALGQDLKRKAQQKNNNIMRNTARNKNHIIDFSICLFFASLAVFLWSIILIPSTPSTINIDANDIASTIPTCGPEVASLPIFLVYVDPSDGSGKKRGTTFLVDDEYWITAAHVVSDGLADKIEISTELGLIPADIVSINIDADIAILQSAPMLEYNPIQVDDIEYDYFDPIWNVGFAGWADKKQVISSGYVEGFGEGVVYTSSMIEGGMSGGPTLSCIDGELKTGSIISKYSNSYHSERLVIVDGDEYIRETYVNSGNSLSALLSEIDHGF